MNGAAILTASGRSFVAIGMAAFGVHQLAYGSFVRWIAKLPTWVPVPSVWPYVTGLIFLFMAIAIATRKVVRPAANVLFWMLLGIAVALQSMEVWSHPGVADLWVRATKVFALSGAALLAGRDSSDITTWLNLLPPMLLAVFLYVRGIAHFIYANFVQEMVPAWIPARLFWAYFTGAALLAGGVGIAVRQTAYWADLLSGLMVLPIPRALADLRKTGETTAIFEALAISGAAFLIAARAERRS